MREFEDYVLDSPITLTSAYDNHVEKFRAALLARQISHPRLVEFYQSKLANNGVCPQSPSHFSQEWDDAPKILPGGYIRMWYNTPLSPCQPTLSRESDSPEL